MWIKPPNHHAEIRFQQTELESVNSKSDGLTMKHMDSSCHVFKHVMPLDLGFIWFVATTGFVGIGWWR
jgi:hypothetical protein